MSIMCLSGIAVLVVLLKYADFQEGKGITVCICVFIIGNLGLIAYKCFRRALHMEDIVQVFQETVSPKEEAVQNSMVEQSTAEAVSGLEPESVSVVEAENTLREMPEEILYNIRTTYTGQHAVNDMRIIKESLAVMEKTADIDTFLSRYKTAMRCVLTLEQAKKSGQQILLPDGYSRALVSAKNKALSGMLYRSFKKELDELKKLKTDSGKVNRINRYQEKLRGIYETEIQFIADEAYSDIMQKSEFIKNG